DRALKALALRGAGHLDLVTRGKRFDRNRVSDEQLAGLVAELAHDAMRRGVGLLQVPELGLGQRLLLTRREGQLDSLVAVAFLGAHRSHRARPGLQHGDALDAAIVEKALR